jgi:hypothetical protein
MTPPLSLPAAIFATAWNPDGRRVLTAVLGQWRQAARDLGRGIELAADTFSEEEPDVPVRHQYALVLLAAKDIEAYRKACALESDSHSPQKGKEVRAADKTTGENKKGPRAKADKAGGDEWDGLDLGQGISFPVRPENIRTAV